MFANIFMQRYSQWTLPVGIAETAVGQYSTNWTNLMAGGVIIALPIVILFLCLQRYLVSGMTAGAVKQ
jgi:ABC-type maltose transport system permease subunit